MRSNPARHPRLTLASVATVCIALLCAGCQSDPGADPVARQTPPTGASYWVRVTYDAASFGRMEDRVIAPLEDELSLLPEVERIVTNYTRNQVEMALHARPQTLDTILRQKLQIALSEAAKVLPEGTSEPELLAHDPLGTLLASPAGMRILADAFEIRLDPRRLDRYGLSMEQVAKKIRDDGLSSAPAPQDQGEELKPDLRQALAETVVLDQDPPVKLADVAEIHLRDQAPATGARVRVWPGPGQ